MSVEDASSIAQPAVSTPIADSIQTPGSLRGRTLFVQLALAVVILLCFTGIGTGIWYITALVHGQQADIPAIMMQGLEEQLYFISAVIYAYFFALLALVPYSFWVYRANKNAHALGATGMKHTPGWAVGWTFIPVANVVKPFMILDEIWKATKQPGNMKLQIGSHLVGWAWICVVLGSVGNRVAFHWMGIVDSYDGQVFVAIVSIVCVTLFALSGILLVLFYGKVNRLQTEMMRIRGYF